MLILSQNSALLSTNALMVCSLPWPAQWYNDTSHTTQHNILHIIFAKEIRLIRIRVALLWSVSWIFHWYRPHLCHWDIYTSSSSWSRNHHHASYLICHNNKQVDGFKVEVKYIWRLCVCISKNISWVQISINDKEEYSFKNQIRLVFKYSVENVKPWQD